MSEEQEQAHHACASTWEFRPRSRFSVWFHRHIPGGANRCLHPQPCCSSCVVFLPSDWVNDEDTGAERAMGSAFCIFVNFLWHAVWAIFGYDFYLRPGTKLRMYNWYWNVRGSCGEKICDYFTYAIENFIVHSATVISAPSTYLVQWSYSGLIIMQCRRISVESILCPATYTWIASRLVPWNFAKIFAFHKRFIRWALTLPCLSLCQSPSLAPQQKVHPRLFCKGACSKWSFQAPHMKKEHHEQWARGLVVDVATMSVTSSWLDTEHIIAMSGFYQLRHYLCQWH